MKALTILFVLVWISGQAHAAQDLFADDFNGRLGEGWTWRREHQEAWRVADHGLEVRIEPGNMWGPQNDALNVLLRPAPSTTNVDLEIEISVTIENQPTNQYEQADLVWYFDDSNMVKLGQEMVDGKVSIVMGREEQDKTRTLAIIPLGERAVRLRLLVKGNQVRGEFRPAGAKDWKPVGHCEAPKPGTIRPQISLQFYQGATGSTHWARVSEFRVRELK